jgi:hypothetical protein
MTQKQKTTEIVQVDGYWPEFVDFIRGAIEPVGLRENRKTVVLDRAGTPLFKAGARRFRISALFNKNAKRLALINFSPVSNPDLPAICFDLLDNSQALPFLQSLVRELEPAFLVTSNSAVNACLKATIDRQALADVLKFYFFSQQTGS